MELGDQQSESCFRCERQSIESRRGSPPALFLGREPDFASRGGDTFANVYLDPANVPTELMLQWNDGTWEHRAYWGGNRHRLWK